MKMTTASLCELNSILFLFRESFMAHNNNSRNKCNFMHAYCIHLVRDGKFNKNVYFPPFLVQIKIKQIISCALRAPSREKMTTEN